MDFKEIVDWCVGHWQFCVTCALALVNFVVLLLSKKVKVNDVAFASVIGKLPSLITEAETKFGAGHGTDKLSYVVKTALLYLVQITGESEKKIVLKYGQSIQDQVEAILDCPEKK